MKKTNKIHPITAFRLANEARQKNVRGSIKKAQDGIAAGPQTELQSIMSDAQNSQPPIPYANRPSREELMMQRMMESPRNVATANSMRASQGPPTNDERKQVINKAYQDAYTNRPKSNTPMMDSLFQKKKGGSVKRKK
jgi:hypothetical protein